MKKIELLAPAGNMTKLKYALSYGADAVYVGGNAFSLRALADNFDLSDLEQACKYVHEKGKKIFLTLNIFAHNEDIDKIKSYLEKTKNIDIDAYIVSDIGIISLIKDIIDNPVIHVSTQANVTNYQACRAYYNLGAKRVILARELSFEEIIKIREKVPNDLELEVFVHGAMCISYSGRCLLSNYMTYRDSNRGNCAQACRWKYALMEEKREGEYFPIEEDEKGAYILNSKDLCLIEEMDKLINAGINSVKIEGRMKSLFYVSTVVNAYRNVIDHVYREKSLYSFNKNWLNEVGKASHRRFTKGFFYGKPNQEESNTYENSSYIREYKFIGIIKGYRKDKKLLWIEQRNRFKKGDKIEILRPNKDNIELIVSKILDNKYNEIEVANHPQMNIYIPWDEEIEEFSILRKKNEEGT